MHAWSTQALTGLTPVESPAVHRSHLEAGSMDAPEGLRGLVHPDNPLLWVALILGATVGLVGVSGSARVGKGKVSVSLDKA